jgi:hypothetical protein
MLGSKISYIAVGTSAMAAFIGALVHSEECLLLGAVFMVFNWYVAEHNRKIEEAILIAEYEASKSGENKND